MYVKDRMTPNPYTIAPEASITEVVELMRQRNLKRIPVVNDDNVPVGIITDSDLQKVSPTKATALNVYEINYLLSKITVKDAMSKNLISIAPGEILEEAAVRMRANHVGTLLVIGDDGKLAGIITESDIFEAFIDLLGARDIGTRFSLLLPNKPGVLADTSEIVNSFGVNINHLAVYSADNDMSHVIMRVNALDTEALEKTLAERGYKIVSVIKNRTNNICK